MATQARLDIRDETTFSLGRPEFVIALEFPATSITARELIRARVYQEVQNYNAHTTEYFHGLVQPTEAEQTLNGFRMAKNRSIDWERQYELAVKAFESNGFIILVDDKQVESLEQVIEIRPQTSATFLKLLPLVGG